MFYNGPKLHLFLSCVWKRGGRVEPEKKKTEKRNKRPSIISYLRNKKDNVSVEILGLSKC